MLALFSLLNDHPATHYREAMPKDYPTSLQKGSSHTLSLSLFFYRPTIGRCRQNPTIVVNTSPYHGNTKESMFMSYCLWNERERESYIVHLSTRYDLVLNFETLLRDDFFLLYITPYLSGQFI
jgi:hypothetical protein